MKTTLIPYAPPNPLTFLEQAILRHGTLAECQQVWRQVLIRRLHIPKSMISEADGNYSSARIDSEASND